MKKVFSIFTILTIACFLIVGCSSDETSMSPSFKANMAPIIIPSGATVTSAKLFIFVAHDNNQTINIHRITSDWDEVTVTWNSFGGAYNGAIEGSFVANLDWQSADITPLFNGWVDGSYANFGLLLDQADLNYPRADFLSREFYSRHPYLEVCYMEGGVETCIQTEVIADTYIWELAPDVNNGTSERLYTGWASTADLEKQSLLRFEVSSTPPQDGCSHTIGYWKTHAGFGPQADVVSQYLPIMLGSMEVTDAGMAVDVLTMKTYGAPKNGITKLMAQLLGAKLSIADGASESDIASEIADADAFLTTYDWTDWNSLSKDQKNEVLNLMSTFDDYNNGYIGPGHCDEFNPDHDYSYGENVTDGKESRGKNIKQ